MAGSSQFSPEEHEELARIQGEEPHNDASNPNEAPSVDPHSGLFGAARICQSYTRALLEERLSARLKRTAHVTTGELTSGTFTTFIERVDSPSILCVYAVGARRNRAVIDLSQSIAFSSVDLLMGGKGHPPVETRPLSELEQRFLSGMFDSFSAELSRAWRQLIPESEWEVVQEAQFTYTVDDMSPTERMFIADFEVAIEDLAVGTLLLGIPLSAAQAAGTRRTVSDEHIDPLKSPLSDIVPLRVQVVLPPADITVHRLLEIEEGDTLELSNWDLVADDDGSLQVVVCVERQPTFMGRLGTVNRRKAVEITGEANALDL